MRVNVGGHTAKGKRIHAVLGQWSYESNNTSWCGATLTGSDRKMVNDVDVTCKNCERVTPTYSRSVRNAAWEYQRAWGAGFNSALSGRVLRDLFPDWQGDYITLSRIILSGAKPEESLPN